MFKSTEEEVVLCSPMDGRLTLNGKPVANAKIERLLIWKNEKGETDVFSTDSQGYFSLPIKKDTVKLSKIAQFVVTQEVRVFVDGQEYLIWTMGKSSKEEYGELDGKPVNLRCELSDDDQPMRLEDALLVTKCKWDSIEPN